MSDDTKQSVQQQFGAHAAGYVTSAVHAKGADLTLLPEMAGLTGRETVLDVATGTGNTAFALAPYAAHVTGLDLTLEMLGQARQQAVARGVGNVAFVQGDAEQLPFPADSFDVVTCRIAAHHFPDVGGFCAEAYRVLKPGGRFLLVDNVAPEADELDRFINEIDKLRDPSHFRSWRVSEWERFLAGAGFAVAAVRLAGMDQEREDWLARMGVPEPVAADIRRRFDRAPEGVRTAFSITATHFRYPKVIMLGRKDPPRA